MPEQADHVVLRCTNGACGMRYPSPPTDPRRDTCPLCGDPVVQVDSYAPPSAPPPATPQVAPGSIVGVLDNIRSALNVGTMLRSADGAQLDHVYLAGLTAGADNPKVVKTALGAERAVPSSSALDGLACVQRLQARGYELWAIELTDRSVPLDEIDALPERLAFVVGNELAGVDPAILALADRHVHLDMFGRKTTLNVGVVFGTAAYWFRSMSRR